MDPGLKHDLYFMSVSRSSSFIFGVFDSSGLLLRLNSLMKNDLSSFGVRSSSVFNTGGDVSVRSCFVLAISSVV